MSTVPVVILLSKRNHAPFPCLFDLCDRCARYLSAPVGPNCYLQCNLPGFAWQLHTDDEYEGVSSCVHVPMIHDAPERLRVGAHVRHRAGAVADGASSRTRPRVLRRGRTCRTPPSTSIPPRRAYTDHRRRRRAADLIRTATIAPMLEPLGNPSFRRLWLADLSKTGSQISQSRIILFLFETRHAVAPIALLVVFNTLPAALTTSMTGFIADRCGKRIVMVGADLVRVALLLVTCLQPEMGVILAARLDSFAAGVFEPAKNAAIPFIVGRDEVVKANGLLQAAGNVTIDHRSDDWRGAVPVERPARRAAHRCPVLAASAWLVLRASITDESGVPAAAR